MSFKIALIGAGSVTFARKLLKYLLSLPEFNNIEIALMDINPQAANHYGGVRALGLCHGVQAGHGQIARVLELPQEEVDISGVLEPRGNRRIFAYMYVNWSRRF